MTMNQVTIWWAVILLTIATVMPAALAQERLDDVRREREREMPVERQLERVREQLGQNQVPQAAATLRRIKQDHPEHADVLAYEGRIFIMQNNVNGATTALNAAL